MTHIKIKIKETEFPYAWKYVSVFALGRLWMCAMESVALLFLIFTIEAVKQSRVLHVNT